MTDSELSWLSLEPSAQDLAWQRFWEEQRHVIINAFALPPDEIGEPAMKSNAYYRNRGLSDNKKTFKDSLRLPAITRTTMPTIEYVDPPERTEPVTSPLVTEKPETPLLNRVQRRQLQRYVNRKARAKMARARRTFWIRDRLKMDCPRCGLYFIAPATRRCQCQVQQRHRCMLCGAVSMASQQAYRATNVCAECGATILSQWENEEASRDAAYQWAGELQRWSEAWTVKSE